MRTGKWYRGKSTEGSVAHKNVQMNGYKQITFIGIVVEEIMNSCHMEGGEKDGIAVSHRGGLEKDQSTVKKMSKVSK